MVSVLSDPLQPQVYSLLAVAHPGKGMRSRARTVNRDAAVFIRISSVSRLSLRRSGRSALNPGSKSERSMAVERTLGDPPRKTARLVQPKVRQSPRNDFLGMLVHRDASRVSSDQPPPSDL